MFDIGDAISGIIGLILVIFGGFQFMGKKKAEQENDSLKMENSIRKQEADHYKDIVRIHAKKVEIQQEMVTQDEETIRAPDKYSRT